MKKFIGEEMFFVRKYDANITETLAYKINKNIDGLDENINFDPETQMEVMEKGDIDGKETFLILGTKYNKNGVLYEVYIEIFPNGRLASRYIWIKNRKFNTKTTTLYFPYKTAGEIEFSKSIKKEIAYIKDKNIKWALYYSGTDGNSIKLSYKEFIDDFTRPVFTQELTYDKTQNKIRYKNIQIEVLKADNDAIEYKIIDDL